MREIFDRGSRSHDVGTVLTVKIAKDSYDNGNQLQWCVHDKYAFLSVQCVVFAVHQSQYFEMHFIHLFDQTNIVVFSSG